MHERKIAYRPAFLRDVKRLKNKHYNMNTLK
ncbi:type II toxin-antitoxin system YafQ family toxin [Cutibacterium acnes]|nr:type II toxin-antitoxin system YafQ family toxin [Cutibacterium modestum]